MHTGAIPQPNGVIEKANGVLEVDSDPLAVDLNDNYTFPSSEAPTSTSPHWREQQEMQPVWLCEVTRAPVTYAACISCARTRQQPSCPFPPTLLTALHAANQPDDVVEAIRHTGYPVLRVSSLLGCKYKSWLGRNQGYPLETPSEHWARLRGTLIHKAIEEMGAAGSGLIEQRLTAFVWDENVATFVSGRVDLYDIESRTLFDFKTVNTGKGGINSLQLPKPRHVNQLQIYSWLLAKNGYPPPTSIRIAYLTMSELRTVDAPAPDLAARERIEQWVLSIARDLLSPTPPPARALEPWECRLCPFTQCKANKR